MNLYVPVLDSARRLELELLPVSVRGASMINA
jgi:hypothetical protein